MAHEPETEAIHAGRDDSADVTPLIHPSTTYRRDANYQPVEAGLGYSRDHNPTFRMAEKVLCRLEAGVDAALFSSGTAAADAVFSQLLPGQRIVAPSVMYWGLRNSLKSLGRDRGVDVEFFDGGSIDSLAAALDRAPTRMAWLETPTNPTWDVVDIAEAATVAHRAGALLAVDSTVATPVLTRPLELGADLVVHSATKYLNGHSDAVIGAVVCARPDDFWQAVRAVRVDRGSVPGVFESWLLQRGLKTLFVRVRRSSETALAIARHFADDPRLEKVLYPGLPGHPGHDVARRQMAGGFGGMLSLCVKGNEEEALAVAARCRLFTRATSLGSVESLIEHRRTVEGPESPVPGNLLRLSVGLEAAGDLIADLDQALG